VRVSVSRFHRLNFGDIQPITLNNVNDVWKTKKKILRNCSHILFTLGVLKITRTARNCHDNSQGSAKGVSFLFGGCRPKLALASKCGRTETKVSTFITRSITGIVLVALIVASIFASQYSFMVLLFLINLLGLSEFYKLIAKEKFRASLDAGILLSTVLFTSTTFAIMLLKWNFLLVNVLFVAIIFIRELYRNDPNPFQNLAFTMFGVAYITLPIIFFSGIAFIPLGVGTYHPELILGYFILLWTSDSGAYAVGSLLGKHKLWERISPKKTWEGSIGGMLLTVGAAYLVSIFISQVGLHHWIVIAVIVVVMGTFGDLFKSLLKRSSQVKDSGNILPGHGGILDRFDSLIGSAPFVFSYLMIFSDWKLNL
jgi:phosphatidate cytidylyltransferase